MTQTGKRGDVARMTSTTPCPNYFQCCALDHWATSPTISHISAGTGKILGYVLKVEYFIY
jgi:hypothetical protein